METNKKVDILSIGDISCIKAKNFNNVSTYMLTNSLDEDIKHILEIKADIIVINIDKEVEYLKSKYYHGLELIIWLRIKGDYRHIMAISGSPLQRILKIPIYGKYGFIFGSKGISLWKENDNFEDINYYTLRHEAETNNVKEYLIHILNIASFRHEYANIWGLKKLIEAHELVTSIKIKTSTSETIESLDYQIAEYISKHASRTQIKENDKVAIQALLNSIKESRYNKNILFIDDKAESGWYAFLKDVLPSSARFINFKFDNINDNYEILLKNLLLTVENNNIGLIISDLRLFDSENNKLNYDDFASIKLMKKIRTITRNGRLRFPELKYMLFTASNKLVYYKSMIKGKNYAPHGLFIKEGLDFGYDNIDSFNNYKHLLKTLESFFVTYSRKNVELVELWDEDECRKVFALENSITANTDQSIIANIKSNISEYTHIILDTNIYMHEHNIALVKEKIIMTYPVFLELKRNADNPYFSRIAFLSSYFTKGIDKNDRSLSLGLSNDDINYIDAKFNSGKKLEDLADKYFTKILNYYSNIGQSHVLFITNDWKDKDNQRSAGNAVLDWIRDNSITNVFVKMAIEVRKTNATVNAGQDHQHQALQVKESEIFSIKKSKTGLSYNFTLKDSSVISIKRTMFQGNPTVKDIDKKLLRKGVSYVDDKSLTENIISLWNKLRELN